MLGYEPEKKESHDTPWFEHAVHTPLKRDSESADEFRRVMARTMEDLGEWKHDRESGAV